MKEKLLIVEGDNEIQAQLCRTLDPEYDLVAVVDRPSALRAFRDVRPPVVVLDLESHHSRNSEDALAILFELLSIDSLLKIIVIKGERESDLAREAVAVGAYEVVNKPVNMDALKLALVRCYYVGKLERERREMKHWIRCDSFEGLLGSCPPIQSVFTAIRQVAGTDTPVLIIGESGTGKELTARAIHLRSSRKDGPFETLDCEALSETELEYELFGQETQAANAPPVYRKGRIENSNGGTLYLNQIAAIPSAVQSKLLHHLQERTIDRGSGGQSVRVDSRIIIGSNVDLKKALTTGSLSEELYYRIAVVQINLPPLRERGEDIVLLARAFLHEFAGQMGKREVAFSAEALRAVRGHAWPGNVQELQTRVRHAVLVNKGSGISAADLFTFKPSENAPSIEANSLREARERVEREMIRQALGNNGGNVTAASVELGISRPTLYTLMQKLGIGRNL